METSRGLVRMAVVVGVLMVGAAPAVSEAAPFSYGINVTLEGIIIGSGSVLFPTDDGALPAVQLDLKTTLFGHEVTFTDANILGIAWVGADPDAAPPLFTILSLTATLGDNMFVLTDDGGGAGSAICTDLVAPLTACRGGEVALTDQVAWTYTPQDAPVPVPEPSTTVTLLAGLGYIMRQRFMRKVRS